MSQLTTEEVDAPVPAPVMDYGDVDLDATQDERPEGAKTGRQRRLAAKVAAIPREDRTPEMREIERASDASIRDWLQQLASENGEIKIAVVRKRPHQITVGGKTYKTDGTVGSYEEFIDEERLLADYGGGDYTLRISKMTAKGPRYVTSRDVKLPGEPRIDNLPMASAAPSAAPAAPAAPARDPIAEVLLTKTLQRADRLEDEARTSRNAPAFDPAIIEAFTRPLRDANERLERELAEMRRDMREAAKKPAVEDAELRATGKLLDKLIDGDSSRLEATRMRFESEMRQIKENAREDEKRMMDRHAREIDDARKDRDRLLADQKSSYEREISALRSSFDVQRQLLQGEIDRLKGDLTAAKAELAELKAKKDKSFLEQANDIKKLKEALNDDDGDESESKGIAGVIGKLAESKVAEVVVDRLLSQAQPPAPPPPQQQAMLPPPGRPFRGQDGKFYVNDGTQVVPFTPPKKKKDAAPPAGAPPAEGEVAAAPEPAVMPVIDPENAAKAIAFLETAYRGGADPVEFANSARTMVPQDIVNAIRAVGVDRFLDQMAGLQGSSPLAMQAGRNWCRKVGKALIGE